MKRKWDMSKRSVKIPIPGGLSPEQRRRHRLICVRSDLVRVARLFDLPEGVAPTLPMYRENGRFSTVRVCSIAGSARNRWAEAMPVYRLALKTRRGHASDDALIQDLQRVAATVGDAGRMPTIREYQALGQYPVSVVWKRFGSDGMGWEGAARRAMLRMDGNRAMRYRNPQTYVEDYRRLAANLGYSAGGPGPSFREFEDRMGYCPITAARAFKDSWSDFVARCGFTPREMHSGRPIDARRAA